MEEWRTYKLEDICYFEGKRTDDIKNYISTENMLPNKGGVTNPINIPSGSAIEYTTGDTLISNIRPYFKKIWLADRDGACSADVMCIKARENVDKEFLYFLLSQDSFFDYVMAGAKGCKMPRGDKKHIMQWTVKIPSLANQKKISQILKSINNKAELNKRINDNFIPVYYLQAA